MKSTEKIQKNPSTLFSAEVPWFFASAWPLANHNDVSFAIYSLIAPFTHLQSDANCTSSGVSKTELLKYHREASEQMHFWAISNGGLFGSPPIGVQRQEAQTKNTDDQCQASSSVSWIPSANSLLGNILRHVSRVFWLCSCSLLAGSSFVLECFVLFTIISLRTILMHKYLFFFTLWHYIETAH